MNAVTVHPKERFKPEFPAVVFTYTDALKALANAGGSLAVTAIAEQTERVPSNLRRDQQKLRDAGVIEPSGDQWDITDKGRRWLVGQDVAAGLLDLGQAGGQPSASDGAAPAGYVALKADEMEFDPENARTHSGLTPAKIEEMALSVADRYAQGKPIFMQEPEVRLMPADYGDGSVWRLVYGERRVRGWRLAIERQWLPADHVVNLKVFTGDEDEATEEALIENLLSEGLDNLEAGEGLLNLQRREARKGNPHKAADIARKIGRKGDRGERWVQERLKVAQEASPADKQRYLDWTARYEAAGEAYNDATDPDVFRWTNLRNSVKRAKHLTALEKNPRLAMLVVELALASEALNGVWDGSVPVRPYPPGNVVDQADKLELVFASVSGSGATHQNHLRLLTLATDWLAAEGFGDDHEPMLANVRIAALGDFGAAALAPDTFATDFLNPPPPAADPEPQIIAPEPAIPTVRPGLSGDEFSRLLRESQREEPEAGAPDSDPSLAPASTPSEPASPPPNPAAQVEADPPPAGSGLTSLGGDDAPPDAAEATPSPSVIDRLPPLARLALLETATAIRTSGQDTKGGGLRGAPLHDFHKDTTGAWSALFTAKLIMAAQAANGGGFLAVLTQAALDALAAQYSAGVTVEDCDDAALAAGFGDEPSPGYETAWLNAPAKAAPEPRSAPPAAPATSAPHAGGDPVIAGLRKALADALEAANGAATILIRLIDGEGAGDEEMADAVGVIQQANEDAKPYLPKEQA